MFTSSSTSHQLNKQTVASANQRLLGILTALAWNSDYYPGHSRSAGVLFSHKSPAFTPKSADGWAAVTSRTCGQPKNATTTAPANASKLLPNCFWKYTLRQSHAMLRTASDTATQHC